MSDTSAELWGLLGVGPAVVIEWFSGSLEALPAGLANLFSSLVEFVVGGDVAKHCVGLELIGETCFDDDDDAHSILTRTLQSGLTPST